MKEASENVRKLVMTNVAGSVYCKFFYYSLAAVISLIFIRGAYGTLAASRTDTISSSSLSYLGNMTWPTIAVCWNKRDMEALSLMPDQDYTYFKTFNWSSVRQTCSSPGEVWASSPVIYGSDPSLHSTTKVTCASWTTGTNFTNTLELAYQLQRHDNATCVSFNEGGALQDFQRGFNHVDGLVMQWWTQPKVGFHLSSASAIYILDSELAKSKNLVDHVMSGYLLTHDIHLRWGTILEFEMDTLIDDSAIDWSTSLCTYFMAWVGLPPCSAGRTTRYYKPTFSSAPGGTFLKTGTFEDATLAFLQIRVRSFMSKTTIIRSKTFDEIWSALGGTWASAMLMMSLFFVRKSVNDPEGKEVVAKDVCVSRFQTLSSVSDLEALILESLDGADQLMVSTGVSVDGLSQVTTYSKAARKVVGGVQAARSEAEILRQLRVKEEDSGSDTSDSCPGDTSKTCGKLC
ncbi:unnamed protein product [Polarella glacialis]|uniref:Uncharacterized protein n=1 Tax=Polarella glacialis TaxID=89957 RepID=A0A813FHM7_POLGL|nr:unnamed protein product [Polarella glacialis]